MEVMVRDVSSLVLRLPGAVMVGALLTATTVMARVPDPTPIPSLALNVTTRAAVLGLLLLFPYVTERSAA
jgi:hypothetical protein